MAESDEPVTRRELLDQAASGLRRFAAEFLERRFSGAQEDPLDFGVPAPAVPETEGPLDTLDTILAKLPRASDEDLQLLLSSGDPIRDHPRVKRQQESEQPPNEDEEQPA